MEWIKAILEKHKAEDGTYNLEAAMAEINTEFPKNAVPKSTFNQTNDDLKAANKLVGTLKKDNQGIETLQATIKNYETKVSNLEAERVKERTTAQLREALTAAGAVDVDYMIFKMGDVEADKEGVIKDLDSRVKQLKEGNPTQFKDAGAPGDDKGKGGPGYKVIDTKLPGGGTQKIDVANMTVEQINAHWDEIVKQSKTK